MNGLTLEDEVEWHLAAAYEVTYGKEPTREWLRALAMRTGTEGNVATLNEAGQAADVTRERVRQVTSELATHLKGSDLTKALRIAEELVRHSPVAEPIGALLAATGLTRPTLTGAAFLNLLRIVGTSPMDLVGTDLLVIDDWLVEESEVPTMGAMRIASKHTSKYGMTTVEEVRQALATAENPLDGSDIDRVLRAIPDIHWHVDWLWLEKERDSPHSSRLTNTARSILSVNSPQTVASIHEGCRRLWKFRKLDILPPLDAMRAFFDVSPHFVLETDSVTALEPLDYHDILGDVTATIIDVLKSTPHQAMDRHSLHEACIEAGIKRSTIGIWTTYAEWMERVAPNVWGLRGGSPNPGAVLAIQESARLRSKAEPHRKQWAWAADGEIVQTMDVTTSLLDTGVLSFEAEVHDVLAGRALNVMVSGVQVTIAKIGAEHGFSWGWHPALKELAVAKGDVLQIRINIGKSSALILSGGQELWS